MMTMITMTTKEKRTINIWQKYNNIVIYTCGNIPTGIIFGCRKRKGHTPSMEGKSLWDSIKGMSP